MGHAMSSTASRTLIGGVSALGLMTLAVLGAVPPTGSATLSADVVAAPAAGTYTAPVPADLSALSWSDAFDALHAKLASEYAFTEWKGLDWAALHQEYQPQIAHAEDTGDPSAYYLALRAYVHELRDGHVSITDDDDLLQDMAGGGFGLIASSLASGRVAATWVKPGGPAARAGIATGARIVAWDGAPVRRALAATSTVLGPQQPTDVRRASERLRFLVRAPIGAARVVSFVNPGGTRRTVTLTAVEDGLETLVLTDGRSVISTSGIPRRMVEHSILPGNIGYVRVLAEIDLPDELPGDHTPTLKQFRSAMGSFIRAGVGGVIVDVRSNSGGSDQMVADMLGSFSRKPSFYEYQNYVVPETGGFQIWVGDDVTGEYGRPGRGISVRPAPEVYAGPVVALVNNGCISSGEGVAMGIRRLPQGEVVGFQGTNGSFGMVGDGVLLPGGIQVGWPFGQSLGEDKVVQIDSRGGRGGILPDRPIPMTLRNAVRSLAGADVELEYGLRALARLARAS